MSDQEDVNRNDSQVAVEDNQAGQADQADQTEQKPRRRSRPATRTTTDSEQRPARRSRPATRTRPVESGEPNAAGGATRRSRPAARTVTIEKLTPDEEIMNGVVPQPVVVEEVEINVSAAGQALAGETSSAPADVAYEMEVEIRNQADPSDVQGFAAANFLAGVLHMIGENIERMTPAQIRTVLDMLKDAELKDYLDRDFWQGIWMVVDYQIKEQTDFIQRRIRGEYETDAYGMDRELIEVVRPFFNFMYRTWWRTAAEGLVHVPTESRGLLVSNHSGVLPWDGAMIATAVLEDHPAHTDRVVRTLFLNWFSTLPFIAPTLSSLGQVPGLPDNAVRLLSEDQLVCVFPEGLKGVGKLFKDRYKLARFGRGGFVQAALRTNAPIIPVAVVGAEETYPMLANFEPLARLLGLPYFPVTPLFPWLGPVGVIPLPTRWSITFCPKVDTSDYGPEDADDPLVVFTISEQVRSIIQETLNRKVAERKSVF